MTRLVPKKVRTCLLTTVLAIASLTAASYAQLSGPLLRVEVPFAFESDSRHFAAGTYYVRVGTGILTIQGSGESMITSTVRDESLDAAPTSAVVFRRYGDKYFLREVRVAGRKTHVYCLPAKAEKQVQVAFASQHSAGVSVALLDSPQ